MDKPVLIVTVTKIEAQSVLNTFAPTDDKTWKSKSVGKKTYYELGIHGNIPVFMVQSEMGSATPGGAILTVSQAIQDIQPQAVIMCGIAFGLRPGKQELGDILIARQILCYEPQKIDLSQGQIPRGDRVMASARLLDRFRSADNNWAGAKTHFGLVMSGEKLVNDPDFRSWLLQSEPEAIGGEMEGAGLYVAARDTDAEWIMVKAICDWGDGNKNSDVQPLAAENSARFVLHVLQQGGFRESEKNGTHGDLGITYPTQVEGAKSTFKYEKAVFVSYAWGGESEKTVDELEHAFAERGILIIRDKKDLEYKGSIQEFEQRIGQGQCVILVISDKYLRSEHCMYELVEIDDNREFRKRVFPIVLENANIYKSSGQLDYIQYWEKETAELNQKIKQVGMMTNISGITTNLDKFASIRAKFDHLANLLSDMNALTPEIHASSGFSKLISAVETALVGESPKSESHQEIIQPTSVVTTVKFGQLPEKLTKQGDVQSPSQRDSSNLEEDTPESRWLRIVGLKENPFRHQDAEERDPYLPVYFSRFTELKAATIADLTSHRVIWLFGGEKGSGKTTLRKFLAAQGRPAKNKANIICIEIYQAIIEQLISTIDDIYDFPSHFFQSIYEKCLQHFPNGILGKDTSWQSQSNIQANLANLSVWLKDHEIDGVLCLIDPSREFFTWKGSEIPIASFLGPLLSFPETSNIGFRYFLPVKVMDELQKKFPSLPQNQLQFTQIEWNEDTLKKLISNRMITLSLEPLALLRSLGQICDDEKKLTSLVDAEIASLAQGNPRAAVWLANRLIEVHCQNSMPSDRISPEDWDEVKSAWWSYGEHRILGNSKLNKLRVLGPNIYYRSHEIVLGGRSNQLLRCLALSKDGFRLREELIVAGWPGENSSGVSEKAMSEAIRRMKEELKREMKRLGFEGFEWIKSVRNRGYRLIYPDMVKKTGEE